MGKRFKILSNYLRYFWTWWIGELTGMVPDRVKSAFFPDEKIGRLCLSKAQLELQFVDGEGTEEKISHARSGNLRQDLEEVFDQAERKGFSSKTLEVELLPDMILSRLIRLPETARNNFRQIISLQFDRYFPLSEDKVLFDCVAGPGKDKKEVTIEAALVRKTLAEELSQRLEAQKITLKKIYVSEKQQEKSAARCFTFLDRTGFIAPEERKPVFALAVCLCLLLPVWLGVYSYKLSARETWLREQAVELSREVKGIEKISAKIVAEQQQRRLYQEKIEEVRLSEILTILTRAVPEDSWITELNKSGDRLTISGKTPNASQLAAGLDRDGFFKRVSNSSTVIQPGENSERFTLSLELKPEDQEDDQQMQASAKRGEAE
ncbi:PilN domain-containing protein [Emcibacter nanhaiensis]|uniref:PilN domain-containing protein n=1 Tax=Emcibacter nanhaiensis TaxID=1505037 RepID=A0A501PG07_9PROT|nr:PilN domain-containing protein [Emcibacter nanhaiensis]TPD58977.1 PilN domain-containing protein [Emcibacter nanhaiensis]